MTLADFESEVSADADTMQVQVLLALWDRLSKFGGGDLAFRYTSLLTYYISLKKSLHRLKKKIKDFDSDDDYAYIAHINRMIAEAQERLMAVQVRKYWLRVEMTSVGLNFKSYHKYVR